QSRVLDGDDGLAGEIAHQLDLLVGERSDLLAVDGDSANQPIVLEHWDGEVGSCASEPGRSAGVCACRVIGNVGHRLGLHNAVERGPGWGPERSALLKEFE